MPAPLASSRMTFMACVGIVLAAMTVYANSFAGPFIFDDLLSIPQNPTLRNVFAALAPPGGGVTVTGRPILNLSFALNYALSGYHVWSYHALNLLIHALAGVALFGIIRRTLTGFGARGENQTTSSGFVSAGDATPLAFAAALLWTVHPLQTESVTYIVQRAESLMGLFYLLTLYCFIRGAESGLLARAGVAVSAAPAPSAPSPRPGGRIHGRSGTWFALAFVSCLLGMGTKEVMVSAPLIVLLYDRTFIAGSFREAWRRRRRVHFALAATWIPLLALVLLAADRGGSAGFGVGVSFWSYAATQFQAVSHYLWLSVWPHPLIVDYGVKWVSSAWDVMPYAAFVTALVAATAVALVRRPALGFLGVCFFAILAPTSLVPIVRQTLAEHRMYLALAPVIVLITLALYAWLGRRVWMAAAAVAVGLGGLSIERNTDYRSSAAIWHDTVVKRPGNAYAHNNYGNILAQSGQPENALIQYEDAIRLDPSYAEPQYNAGNALMQFGRLPEAIAHYEQALRLNPAMPDAQTALGNAFADSGRGAEAIAHYTQALRLDPNFVDAHDQLGIALAKAGQPTEAITQFQQALHINPARPDIQNNLGNVLRITGRTTEAMAHYDEALRIDPNFAQAHLNLGNALRDSDRLPEAIVQYEQALRIDPNQPEAHNNLGTVLLVTGHPREAIAHFQSALRLDPNLAQVHLNLAMALTSVGRSDEAAAQYDAARRLGVNVPHPGN